jgi:hypothetical protein
LLGNDRETNNYTTAVAGQWLSSDHVGIPIDMNATIAQKQRNGVFRGAELVSQSVSQ